jgi:outer membrane protein assembly factor BamB
MLITERTVAMLRRCLGFLLLLAIAGACARDQDDAVHAVWRWRPPRTASVGMPGTDARAAAVTYGHQRLVLLDATGRVAWATYRLGLRDVAPLLRPDRLYAATDTGTAAFDRATGRIVWDVDLGDRANTPVATDDGGLAVTTWDGRLLVLEAATGALRHTVALPGAVLGPAAGARGVALAAWDDGLEAGVVAVDTSSGAVRWQHQVGANGVSSPAIAAHNAVVVTGDMQAVAFSLADGHPAWTRRTSGAGSPEVPPCAGNGLVVADRLGGLLGLAPHNGRVRWRVDGRGAAVRGGPAATGKVVVMPVDDGRVLFRTGDRVTVLDPVGRVSGVAAGPDGIVLVATREAEQNELIAYR